MRFTAVVLSFAVLALCAFGQAPAPAPAPVEPTATQPAPGSAPPTPPPPAPLSAPSLTGPLSNLPPATFEAGFLGNISVNGVVDGMAVFTTNHVPGDASSQAALSNGQIFIQKADGPVQFFIEAGAYNIPALGLPFLSTEKAITDLYTPVPVAFLKLQPSKNTSILVGSLPTLIGAEYTFTFENMNIARGLLWNQENAVNKGIQLNQTLGKFSASFSWNDGFYSNRYTWLTGSLTYANGPHSLAFVGGGNYSHTAFQNLATLVQNNSEIFNVIYTYTKGNWIVQPYWQYTNVPTDAKIGIVKGASTNGGAILVSRAFRHGLALPLRWEYIASTGNAAEQAVNLLFGPGSSGASITVTPTYQHGGLFVRGDFGYVHAGSIAPGSAFGMDGTKTGQVRALLEFGFLFGNNIVEKKL